MFKHAEFPAYQIDKILAALEEGRSLTPFEALREFGSLRLAANVHTLRVRGHSIACELVEVGVVGKRKKRVARYYMPGRSQAHQ